MLHHLCTSPALSKLDVTDLAVTTVRSDTQTVTL
jgi:hypothetical protein